MDPLLFSLFWVFGWVVLLLFAWFVRSGRRQQRLELAHKERMLAMEKGIPLPELSDYEDKKPGLAAEVIGQVRLNPRWPLGVGAVAIMLGIGTSLALWLSQEDYHNRVWSMGLIGVFLGFGLWLHYWLTRPPGRA
jgi:uncharacterized membrane protein YfcA